MTPDEELNRTLNLPLLTLFGLGTMVGAGIYVLVGEIVGVSGARAPWSFLIAAVVAGFTAKSYGELAALFPASGGEAVYVHRAFGKSWLTGITGWAVVATGLVSAATLANGFAGYLQVFFTDWNNLAIALFVIMLGGIASWGIRETVWIAGAITVASLLGLVAVVAVSGHHLERLPAVWPDLLPSSDVSWLAILLGSFVAFYAFIGFEDMVNVAEETHNPSETMPRAIVWALLLSAGIYILVALVAVLASYEIDLANHPAPLAAIVAHAGEGWPRWIALFSVLAVTNSAIAQIVMASRVLYGMGRQGQAPATFATVHPRRKTPLVATVFVTAVILILAIWFPLLTLAKATSFVILLVFILVNLALLRLKITGAVKADGAWIPVIGAILSLALLLVSLY